MLEQRKGKKRKKKDSPNEIVSSSKEGIAEEEKSGKPPKLERKSSSNEIGGSMPEEERGGPKISVSSRLDLTVLFLDYGSFVFADVVDATTIEVVVGTLIANGVPSFVVSLLFDQLHLDHPDLNENSFRW